MSKACVLMATAVLGGLAGIGWVSAQGRGGPATLTGADIAEIERLYARYNQGLDFADEDLYLSVWADDAVLTHSNGEVWTGKDALRKRWRQAPAGEGKTTLHNNTSIVITPTEEGGAKGRAYYILLDVSGKEPRMIMSGHYFDTFVRTGDGWRIKTRGAVRGWDWRQKQR